MKMIHCADIHLESKMNANLPKEKAIERKFELIQTFRRMLDYANQNNIHVILIAGDLFDIKTISATTRNMVRDLIQQYDRIQFYYLRGNHDEGVILSLPEDMPENLHLFDKQWKSYELGESGNVVLTGAEFSTEHLDGAGYLYDTLSLETEKINIVMLHGQESEYHEGDRTELVNLRALRNQHIDYLALGHVHTPKVEKLDGRGKYCYCGCLEGRGFDECGQHGFVVLDIKENTKEIVTEFVPFAKRMLYTVEADITGCNTTLEMEKRVREYMRELPRPEESLVKIKLVGTVDIEGEKELSFIQKQLEPNFYFLKLEDASNYAVDCLRFQKDVSLKGEFIRAVMASNELTEEEKAEVIHYGMCALAGEEIMKL